MDLSHLACKSRREYFNFQIRGEYFNLQIKEVVLQLANQGGSTSTCKSRGEYIGLQISSNVTFERNGIENCTNMLCKNALQIHAVQYIFCKYMECKYMLCKYMLCKLMLRNICSANTWSANICCTKKGAKTVHMAYFLVQRIGPTQKRLYPNLSFNSNPQCNNNHHEKVCNQNCNQWDSLDLKRRQVVPLPPDRPSPSWWFPSQQIYENKYRSNIILIYEYNRSIWISALYQQLERI